MFYLQTRLSSLPDLTLFMQFIIQRIWTQNNFIIAVAQLTKKNVRGKVQATPRQVRSRTSFFNDMADINQEQYSFCPNRRDTRCFSHHWVTKRQACRGERSRPSSKSKLEVFFGIVFKMSPCLASIPIGFKTLLLSAYLLMRIPYGAGIP